MVDDEPGVRQCMRMLLELDGHQVDEAHCGPAALDKLNGPRFDLVFTDFFMPGMKGDELARKVKGRDEKTPVIMVTACPPTPVPDEISCVMLKPFSLGSIRGVLTDFNRECPRWNQAESTRPGASPRI